MRVFGLLIFYPAKRYDVRGGRMLKLPNDLTGPVCFRVVKTVPNRGAYVSRSQSRA